MTSFLLSIFLLHLSASHCLDVLCLVLVKIWYIYNFIGCICRLLSCLISFKHRLIKAGPCSVAPSAAERSRSSAQRCALQSAQRSACPPAGRKPGQSRRRFTFQDFSAVLCVRSPQISQINFHDWNIRYVAVNAMLHLRAALSEAVVEELHVALLLLYLLLQLGDASLQPPLLLQQRRPDTHIHTPTQFVWLHRQPMMISEGLQHVRSCSVLQNPDYFKSWLIYKVVLEKLRVTKLLSSSNE